MSETEHLKGKLVPVVTSTDPESACKLLAEQFGMNKLICYTDYQDWLSDEYYREYFLKGNTVYEILATEVEDEEDILIANEHEDGTFDFELRFHNGGCSMNEALNEAIENIKGKNS